jgi:LAS superfamily LD-carboxypeptidase LdcB
MIRKVLYTLLILIVPFFADAAGFIYYILPVSIGYTKPSFTSIPETRVSLFFGEKIPVSDSHTIDGIVWYRVGQDGTSFYLPGIFTSKAAEVLPAGSEAHIGSCMVDRTLSLPLDYRPADLMPVPNRYKANGYTSRHLLLRREALDVFTRLIDAAEGDGVNIRILSAFRDARYQSNLYYNAIKRHGVLQTSVAKPGHSEHQLGTACDLTTEEIGSALSQSFEKTAAFRWLMSHMTDYGLALSYPRYKENTTGYIFEPWHFRYWGNKRWDTVARRLNLFFAR